MNTQTLIITEKPSVARAIAAALGANVRGEGCIHGNNLIVSWCYGHLVELAVPAAYDEKLGKWRREDLPILPDPWQTVVMRDKRQQFEILRGLMQRKDVGEVVDACDAGREESSYSGLSTKKRAATSRSNGSGSARWSLTRYAARSGICARARNTTGSMPPRCAVQKQIGSLV